MTNSNIFNGNTAIAVLDILGFSNLVNSTRIGELPLILYRIKRESLGSVINDETVGIHIISDTIVIYGTENKEKLNMLCVLVTATNMIARLANVQLPIRGALSFGHMYINKTNGDMIGPALVQAYSLGQKFNWTGAVIDPKYSDDYYNVTINSPCEYDIVKYPAPIKNGPSSQYICLNWINRLAVTNSFLKDLYFPTGKCNDYDVYTKYRNTIDFRNYCVDNYLVTNKTCIKDRKDNPYTSPADILE